MDARLFWQLIADICKLGEFIATAGMRGVSTNIVGKFKVGYDGSETVIERTDCDLTRAAVRRPHPGAVILRSFAVSYLPSMISTSPNGGPWTSAGRALARSGESYLLAGQLSTKLDSPVKALTTAVNVLEKFLSMGRFFLSASLVISSAGLKPWPFPAQPFWWPSSPKGIENRQQVKPQLFCDRGHVIRVGF